jgi:NAD(P)-dependent dehydrogenase (short-subunit alcohol dehydrogenase family)
MRSASYVIGSNFRPGRGLAVVVGAGGLGIAVARRLGERYRLLVADRDPAVLAKRVRELKAEGHDAAPCECDITDPEAVKRLAAQSELAGPIGAIAHVVGLSPSMGSFRDILAVDLVGAALVEQALLPYAGMGTAAVFVSSIAGHAAIDPELLRLAARTSPAEVVDALEERVGSQAATPQFAYCVAKAAVIQMCRLRAPAWAERGGRIVSISPGLIATPMGALEFERQPSKHGLLEVTPLGREGSILEVVDAIDFLASDRASFVTGTDLIVDGGLTALQSANA